MLSTGDVRSPRDVVQAQPVAPAYMAVQSLVDNADDGEFGEIGPEPTHEDVPLPAWIPEPAPTPVSKDRDHFHPPFEAIRLLAAATPGGWSTSVDQLISASGSR